MKLLLYINKDSCLKLIYINKDSYLKYRFP